MENNSQIRLRKFAVCTTFNTEGYQRYGKRMISTFLQNWPKNITLYVYHQDVVPEEKSENLVLRDLNNSCPSLLAFKEKWKNDPKANGFTNDSTKRHNDKVEKIGFKWDAIRFSHKVYSVFHCAKNCDADVLIWMDADTVCHSPITFEFIERMIPETIDLGFLGRDNKYSECGLYSMNLKSVLIQHFLEQFQWNYDHAEDGIFQMKEWHDSFVFDQIRKQIRNLKQYNWSQGLIRGEGHPLINCEWGAYLDHLKGDRKLFGKSKKTDLRTQRTEDYWKTK